MVNKWNNDSNLILLLCTQEKQNADLEKVKTRLADEMNERKENFIVPMKKRKCVLEVCNCRTDSIGLPTPQPSDSEGEDPEILMKKDCDKNFKLDQVFYFVKISSFFRII